MGSVWRGDRATSWLRSSVASELLPIFAMWDCGPILPGILIFQEEPKTKISRSKSIMLNLSNSKIVLNLKNYYNVALLQKWVQE